jgi:hypothetical protein
MLPLFERQINPSKRKHKRTLQRYKDRECYLHLDEITNHVDSHIPYGGSSTSSPFLGHKLDYSSLLLTCTAEKRISCQVLLKDFGSEST